MKVIFFLFLFPIALFGVNFSVIINDKKTQAIETLFVTVVVGHEPGDQIDANSFKLGDYPLDVEKIRSGNDQTAFRFEIPTPEEGIHILPSLSVDVNGKTHTSAATTFEVRFKSKQDPLILKMELVGNRPFFPKQRIDLVYRIYYRGDITLLKEKLHLLESKHFRKVGGLEIRETKQPPYTVQTIKQTVELLKEGEFHFPPSVIEGFLLITDPASGQQTKKPVRSATSPFTLNVTPLPNSGKRLSFTGAVGSYTMDAKLQTPANVQFGDVVKLEIKIRGEGNLESVIFPSLSCLPGFSGFFGLTDFPPAGKIVGDAKVFEVELYPLSTQIKAVPPIEFTYFDSKNQIYHTLKTTAIPISIQAVSEADPPTLISELGPKEDWNRLLAQVPESKQEIKPRVITHQRPLSLHWLFVLVALYLVQLLFRSELKKRTVKKLTLDNLIKKAQRADAREFYHIIEKILPQKEAPEFWKKLEKNRYSSESFMTREEIINEVKKICGS